MSDIPEGHVYADYSEEYINEDDAATCDLSDMIYDVTSTETDTFIDSSDKIHEGIKGLFFDYDIIHLDVPCYRRGEYIYYVHDDLVVTTEDTGHALYVNDAYLSDIDTCYYEHSDNLPENTCGAEHIHDYGEGEEPCYILSSDLSRYTIGFEVEKTDFFGMDSEGEEVGAYELFAAFELDGSCGVEAISHILPLSADTEISDAVFNLMDDASPVIDSASSTSCGGHITIARKGTDSEELQAMMRPYFGVIMALWAPRLANKYCQKNSDLLSGDHEKYSCVHIKHGNLVEIRLPNAVKNTGQLKNRYRLMALLVDAIERKIDFHAFLLSVRPVLLALYDMDAFAVNKRLQMASEFQLWLDRGVLTETTAMYLRESVNTSDYRIVNPSRWDSMTGSTNRDASRFITPFHRVAAYA